MNSWAKVVLSDVAEVFNGKTPSKTEQRSEGHPVLKIRDVSEFGNFRGKHESFVDPLLAKKYLKKQVQEGDTLILNAAHNADYVGSKTYRAEPPVFNTLATGEWLIIRPTNGKLDASFVHHWVTSKSTRSEIRNVVNGIHLYPKDVARLAIFLPPLPEQRRIAAILDQADALRTNRRKSLAQLDSLTQSIFIEMFGDPETNARGFEITKLSALCKRVTDGTHQSPTWSAVGHPFLFVSNIVSGEIDFDTKKFISEETHDELTRRCPIEVGDVLYSTVGSYGVPAVVRTSRKFAFQRHIAHIKPNPDFLDYEFLCAMLDSPSLRKQADRVARGVAQKTVNLSDIGSFLVFKPPLKLQQEFARRTAMVAKLKASHRASLAELDALFSSLQHQAFHGEL